jgi:hypothetical protein
MTSTATGIIKSDGTKKYDANIHSDSFNSQEVRFCSWQEFPRQDADLRAIKLLFWGQPMVYYANTTTASSLALGRIHCRRHPKTTISTTAPMTTGTRGKPARARPTGQLQRAPSQTPVPICLKI